MELKIVNPEAVDTAKYFGITQERLMQLAARTSLYYTLYIEKLHHGFDKDTDENELLSQIIGCCDTLAESIFMALTFEKTLVGLLKFTLATHMSDIIKTVINKKIQKQKANLN